MQVIHAVNVNDAWRKAKDLLNHNGIRKPSRVGETLEVPFPVTTTYFNPRQRVLFDPVRDANPFFHFFEGLWMLAGRNDVAWISQFNQRMMSFSDNKTTYHAAYGYRWRWHFGRSNQFGDGAVDQLDVIVEELRRDPDSRRCVLQVWDPLADLGGRGLDLPCNTAMYFKVRGGQLHMTVTNRSNDIVWGCYGANVFHMSILQEYLAARIGVGVGPYNQVSDSWHAYTEFWAQYGGLEDTTTYDGKSDPYSSFQVEPYQLVDNAEHFDRELLTWMEEPGSFGPEYSNSVFSAVAVPMYLAWKAYKNKELMTARGHAQAIAASDLRLACGDWLYRRSLKKENKAA